MSTQIPQEEEIATWKNEVITKRPDGTFVITHDSFPYQVCDKVADPLGIFSIDEVSSFWDSLPENDPRKQTHREPEIAPPTLEKIKAMKKNAIDANTNKIRDRDGLSYAGERFDMRNTAMLKWTGMLAAAAKDILSFPMTILTIDDKEFTLENQTKLLQFAGAVLSYETSPNSPLTTGRILRQAVESAKTIEEVNAVVDDRE